MVVYSGTPLPFHQYAGFAVIGDMYIVSLIMRLFKASRPITITWFIMSIVVAAVDRVLFRRTIAHVLGKQHEVVPSLAYFYAAFSIICVAVIARIITPIPHIKPNRIQRVCFGYTVRGVIDRSGFPAEATAACGMPACQRISGSLADVAAHTFAPPHDFTSLVTPGYTQDGQTTEDLVDNILEIRMSWKRLKDNAILIVGHLENSFLVQNLIRAARGLNFLSRPVSMLAQ